MNRSMTSLRDQEEMASGLKEENELLKSRVSILQKELNNVKTHSCHLENTVQKLMDEKTELQEKNGKLEDEQRSLAKQKITKESQSKLKERIQELEDKVTKLNVDKGKVKADYDEAVKALEAVDKVVSCKSFRTLL